MPVLNEVITDIMGTTANLAAKLCRENFYEHSLYLITCLFSPHIWHRIVIFSYYGVYQRAGSFKTFCNKRFHLGFWNLAKMSNYISCRGGWILLIPINSATWYDAAWWSPFIRDARIYWPRYTGPRHHITPQTGFQTLKNEQQNKRPSTEINLCLTKFGKVIRWRVQR